MLKTMIIGTAALALASAAIAQNEMAPVSRGVDEPQAKIRRAIGVTALGTYGNRGEERLIDVRLDADSDGDGAKDQGVLLVTCNGGDILEGRFSVGGTAAALAPKLLRARSGSPIAPGKTFKASWDLKDVAEASAASAPVPLKVAGGEADICA